MYIKYSISGESSPSILFDHTVCRMQDIVNASHNPLLFFPLQDSDDTPSLLVFDSLSLAEWNPIPADFAAVFESLDEIPFEDPLNDKSIFKSRLEEPGYNCPARMEPSNNPHLPTRGEEPLHCARKVLMLRPHPEAIRGDDSRKGTLILRGESIVQNTPFMRIHRNGSFDRLRQIVLYIVSDCTAERRRRRVVRCSNMGRFSQRTYDGW